MRFNDTLHTVLAGRTPAGGGAVTRWRQCVDLLAQYDRPGGDLAAPDRDALLDALGSLLPMVPEAQRLASVRDIGRRLRSPALVRFFGGDKPAICAAALKNAQLPDGVWADMIGELSPTARGILRNRRDLGPLAARALAAFGTHDLVLTTDVEAAQDEPLELSELAPEPGPPETSEPLGEAEESQIRRLVNRIESFTSSRAQRMTPPPPLQEEEWSPETEAADEVRDFSFETDADGVIHWVKDAPRGQLIGMSIAQPSPYANAGPDGHVSGAFRHRGPFRNARFTIDAGSLAGEWRMSAIPYFNQQTGRFQGYRGHARRPYFHEMTATPAARHKGLYGSGMQGDSLRELIHELRTPLNAILGFAEIIDHQFFGPVSASYRQIAKDIIADAQQLLATFDDLDLASRMERGEVEARPGAVDASALLEDLAVRFNADGSAGRLSVSAEGELPPLRLDAVQSERMFQHLLRAVLSVTGPGEDIHALCWHDRTSPTQPILFSVDRPAALKGMTEADLFDPGYGPDGEWPEAPLLGIGFSLRLVRNLARGAGGNFRIGDDHFTLILPAMAAAAESGMPSSPGK